MLPYFLDNDVTEFVKIISAIFSKNISFPNARRMFLSTGWTSLAKSHALDGTSAITVDTRRDYSQRFGVELVERFQSGLRVKNVLSGATSPGTLSRVLRSNSLRSTLKRKMETAKEKKKEKRRKYFK